MTHGQQSTLSSVCECSLSLLLPQNCAILFVFACVFSVYAVVLKCITNKSGLVGGIVCGSSITGSLEAQQLPQMGEGSGGTGVTASL